ncbi:polysaccharide deacetylase family protein [Frankia sp. Cr2]|uniref:polysaccharide deacetylase family protein n=1 Tax=Frankia sp. Cr2 TaxID=3073932 RepID=UPI002AD436F1|nr:polysaccharide deacetylase family protein [Frankia sp. Cr2]
MIPVLLYHAVSDHPRPGLGRWTVSTDAFDRHCRFIAECGRTPMTVSQYAGALRAGSPSEDTIVITFDDGYADTFAASRRLAAGIGAATVYVTTSWIDQPGMLREQNLIALAALGVEIGAHSHTHRRLDELTGPDLESEIVTSRRLLTVHTGTPVASFAYPHGNYDRRTRAAVADAGFSSACAVRNTLSHAADDALAIARLTIAATTSDARLRAWLDGDGPPAPGGELLRTRAWRSARRLRARVMRPAPPTSTPAVIRVAQDPL